MVKSLKHNYLNAPKRETSIEIIVRKWLEESEIIYEQQKLLLNTTFADFYVEPKIVIYCDGGYGHSKPYAKERDAFVNKLLKERGYALLRLSEEEEIENSEGKAKLLSFVKDNSNG